MHKEKDIDFLHMSPEVILINTHLKRVHNYPATNGNVSVVSLL